ncbi:MAG: hypothetical protein WC289_04070 [Patescibacteria group bacterium]
MSVATLVCWVAWLMVLYYINPTEAGVVGFLIFYSSFALAVLGTFSLLGFFGRVWFSKEQIIFRHLGVAFRQAVWFAILLAVSLILQSQGLLTWWNGLLLITFLTIVEFMFLSRKTAGQ